MASRAHALEQAARESEPEARGDGGDDKLAPPLPAAGMSPSEGDADDVMPFAA